jgi:L-fuculose-phosphate aldolase
MNAVANKLHEISLRLSTKGLNHGATGNCSCRDGDSFLITPSGINNDDLNPNMMVRIDLSGNIIPENNNLQPSSAVVHTHSPFASTLSLFGKEIPPFHYMIAVTGGDSVRCAPYALFGTQKLSDGIINSLSQRKACLLANHGLVSVGKDLEEAFRIAEEIEHLSQLYIQAKKIGEPTLLTKKEMDEVLDRFGSYGQWAKN